MRAFETRLLLSLTSQPMRTGAIPPPTTSLGTAAARHTFSQVGVQRLGRVHATQGAHVFRMFGRGIPTRPRIRRHCRTPLPSPCLPTGSSTACVSGAVALCVCVCVCVCARARVWLYIPCVPVYTLTYNTHRLHMFTYNLYIYIASICT